MKSRTLEDAITSALKYSDVAAVTRVGSVFALILGAIMIEVEEGDACALRIEKAIVGKMPHLARGFIFDQPTGNVEQSQYVKKYEAKADRGAVA